MTFRDAIAQVATENPDLPVSHAIALADAMLMQEGKWATTHEGRLEWLRKYISPATAHTKPIGVIRVLRLACIEAGYPTSVRECKDALDDFKKKFPVSGYDSAARK